MARDLADTPDPALLQWGPVVVTGIRGAVAGAWRASGRLQWGPVVVTGISARRPDSEVNPSDHASMGSGRGDRNQLWDLRKLAQGIRPLQWGPVVVTGISPNAAAGSVIPGFMLQWGPVVVTGISCNPAKNDLATVEVLQWGPVVVTGIRC